MGEAAAEGEAEHLSARIQRYPRDLLRQFSGETTAVALSPTEDDSGEIELSLGLSLGGCFGVDPAHKRWLHRSSSVASVPFLQQAEEQDHASASLLKRTCSLPAQTEEEQRKRKELQCLRRMEAKRKRTEKVSGRVGVKDAQEDGGGGPGWEMKSETEQLRVWDKFTHFGATAGAYQGGAAMATGRAVEGMVRCFASVPQGSVASQGSSSSALSDLDSRPRKQQGLVNGIQSWSSPGVQSPPELTEHGVAHGPISSTGEKPMSRSGKAEAENPWEKPAAGRGNGVWDMMDEMPCVSTTGGGPNGRRVEGFLYRYKKGEEVRIVCVCHGRFLSPAEFVKHAGSGDVAHPLRHIIVNRSPLSFL